MKILTATLMADGTSDRALLPIIQFLLDTWSPLPNRLMFAEALHNGPLPERLPRVLELYPCDLLFIHRDAEASPLATRQQEIEVAMAQLKQRPPHVCIIPVRMTESWLLLDERAIRVAAGNEGGTIPLKLPLPKAVEGLADPKKCLFDALVAASDRTGRRRRQFRPEAARHRVAELMDMADLRQLPSFQKSEAQVEHYFKNDE